MVHNVAVRPLDAPRKKVLLEFKEQFLQRVGKATLRVCHAHDIQITWDARRSEGPGQKNYIA